MKILGLNTIGFNTSASYINNGVLKCSIEEERLSRIKRTRQFPIKSIDYILNKYKLKFENFDAVAVSWNPLINLEKFDLSQSENKTYIPNVLHSIPNYILKLSKENSPDFFTQDINLKKKTIKVFLLIIIYLMLVHFIFQNLKKLN